MPASSAILNPGMLPINIPNVLTLLRILAVPVIVVALLDETPNGDALAAGVFALATIRSLSASGSMSLPNVVTSWRRRAM